MSFEQKIKEWVQKQNMLSAEDGVLVGLSGGADSVALLMVLYSLSQEWSLKLAALHIHHGIRPEAEADLEFCRHLCEQLQIPFYAEYVNVPELAGEQGIGEEEAGRNARYTFFEKYRSELGLEHIAVAHHQNDQAETMLFQLFRGSGLRGLSGIPSIRKNIIRPLMSVTRAEIEAYLAEKKVPFVTDSTNALDMYARNKIRHHILPMAEELVPGAIRHMNQTGESLREVLDYLEGETAAFLEKHSGWAKVSLEVSLPALREAHPALQKTVILEAVNRILNTRKDISARHVQGILSLLDKGGEKYISLPYGGMVTKSYDKLIFSVSAAGEAFGRTEGIAEGFSVEPDQEYLLEDGRILRTKLYLCNDLCNYLENIPKSDCIKWFDYDKIMSVLYFRKRMQGDYLTIRDDGARKSMQDYFVNEKVPKYERDQIMVLADGQHIIWVPGMRISTHYKITKDTKRILEVHIGGKANG